MFFIYIYIYIYFINDIFHSKTRMLSSAYTLGLFLFKREKKDGNNTDFVLATFYLFYENFFFLQ